MTVEERDLPSLTATELGRANYIASQLFRHGSGPVRKNDMASYLSVARAVYQAAMSAAEQSPDAEDRADHLKVAYMTAYNIAANCWPGWGEEGAAVTDEQRKLGAAFAKAHLEIVSKLDVSAKANAYWINAAHELAAGDHEARDTHVLRVRRLRCRRRGRGCRGNGRRLDRAGESAAGRRKRRG